MNVTVYMIATGRDLPIGKATNTMTLLSLIELAKLKGAMGVSLHGPVNDRLTLSGEASFDDANKLALDNVVA